MSLERLPEIAVFDHYGWRAEQLVPLQAFAEAALEAVWKLPPALEEPSPLQQAEQIELSLVTDSEIARVHQEFMDISGATDVITFHHGEILISVDTAKAQAAHFGHTVDQEVALYIAHGLLHLHGHDDHAPEEAETMRLLQEQVLASCWVVKG